MDFEITTIIPTYRRPFLLRRAIESVLNQTVKSSFVLISDNASGDETRKVVEEYSKADSRVHYSCQPENVGAIKNFATALKKVTTSYFSFLQDDDFLLPWFYEQALEGFSKYPDAGFSACRTYVVDSEGKPIYSQFRYPVLKGYFPVQKGILAMLKTPLSPALWNSVLYKREILDKIEGIDLEAGTAADFAFNVKCACCFPFVITAKPAAALMVWEQSTTFSHSDSETDNLVVVFNNVNKFLSHSNDLRHKVIKMLKQLEISGKFRLWIRLLLAERLSAAKKAKLDFISLGGKLPRIYFIFLTNAESNEILRRLLRRFLAIRKCLYKFFKLCNIKSDSELEIYLRWLEKNKSWVVGKCLPKQKK